METKKLLAYLKKGNKSEKWFAAEIIGAKKQKTLFKQLVTSLNDHDVDEVVVWSLGQIKEKKAIPLLIKKLEKTKDTYVIHRTVEALTDIGKPAIPALIKFLSESKNNEARWRVARALGEIKAVEAFDVLWEEVNDKDKFVRWRAVWAVKCLGKRIIPKIVEKLDEKDPYLRWRALWVLGQISDKSDIPAIKKILKNDKSEFVKWQAKQSIKKITRKES